MEILNLNYPAQSNDVRRCSISCEFCSQNFGTIAEKNARILDHFEQRVCARCDQNLLRIGDNYYILHATLTCITGTTIKHEQNESDGQHDHSLSVIEVHPIDAKQYDDIFMSKEEINDASDQLDATSLDPMTAHIKCETDQIVLESITAEPNVRHELEEEGGLNIVPSTDHQIVGAVRNVPPVAYFSSKASESSVKCDKRNEESAIGSKVPHQTDSVDVQGRYSCSKCGSTNLAEATLKRFHQSPKIKCHKCDALFCRFTQLKDHYSLHPGADPDDGINLEAKLTIGNLRERQRMKAVAQFLSKSFECDICKKSFTSLNQIRKHMDLHEDKYSCSKCGSTNLTEYAFKRYHQNPNKKCHICGVRFCGIIPLKEHYNVHPGANPDDGIDLKSQMTIGELRERNKLKMSRCPVAGCNVMVSIDSRQSHLAVKHKSNQFECGKCKKLFTSPSQLRNHTLTHDKKKRPKTKDFQCEECGKSLSTKPLLLAHIRIHKGEKPFECTFEGCSKKFCTKTNLTEHLRSHTGEKPYQCPVTECDRRFSYAIDLKRHKFNAHGIYTKQFPCPICEEILPENMLLKKHMRKHGIQNMTSN